MSGIKQPLTGILTKLSAIQVVNQDGQTVNLYTRLWNNQLIDTKEGKLYDWPRPAVFVEVISPVNFDVIGLGVRSADLGIKLHLIHEFYNQDGTFEQDLEIFDLRDKILANSLNPVNPGLSQFQPTGCSQLNCIAESQDFDHDNLYHYVLEFICNFIDTKASGYDENAGQFNDTPNPLLDVNVIPGEHPIVTPTENVFIIPQ